MLSALDKTRIFMKPVTEVYLVDGLRTPFLKAGNQRGPFTAADLAVFCARGLLQRQSFPLEAIGEVITGCMIPSTDEANISRVIGLRLGLPHSVPAFTVQRNCASGLQAIDSACQDILLGKHQVVLAGGTEAMSHAPLLHQPEFINWLGRWASARNWRQRGRCLTQLRPAMFKPIISLLRGLQDPLVGLSMGQTAEILANRFAITREAMDEFAVESHQRLAAAYQQGFMQEVAPLIDTQGKVYAQDTGLRVDSTVEKLARLKPVFDKPYGSVTAGNSSQVSDGAAFVILASREAVLKYQLPVLAKIVDSEWAGVDPKLMGLGPVAATLPILKRQQKTLQDIECFEINEAFAAQVLACIAYFKECGAGDMPLTILNKTGGAVAAGHPVGASGARLVLHVAETLKREQTQWGIASLCIGGGQGGAMLLQRVENVK
jgi:acetyl-CoA C-acetyltransferase